MLSSLYIKCRLSIGGGLDYPHSYLIFFFGQIKGKHSYYQSVRTVALSSCQSSLRTVTHPARVTEPFMCWQSTQTVWDAKGLLGNCSRLHDTAQRTRLSAHTLFFRALVSLEWSMWWRPGQINERRSFLEAEESKRLVCVCK